MDVQAVGGARSRLRSLLHGFPGGHDQHHDMIMINIMITLVMIFFPGLRSCATKMEVTTGGGEDCGSAGGVGGGEEEEEGGG